MKKLFKVIALALLVACGSESSSVPKSDRQSISERIVSIRSWAPTFSGAPTKDRADGTPGDNGDMVLFNGLLCYSGEQSACDFVRRSQDPRSGRFFRSPEARARFQNTNEEPKNAFSRDMALGVLLYVATKQDKTALREFAAFIDRSGNKLCFMADDNRCEANANIRYLITRLAEKLQQPVAVTNTINAEIYLSQLVVSARLGELGFPQHLIGVQVLLLEQIGISQTASIENVRNILHSRNPQNAFFSFLVGDKQLAAKQFLMYAPQTETENKRQWSFERKDSEQAHLESMGWEFIFLGNLLLDN